MHIVCAMFGRDLGGLEQSLIDYCDALSTRNHSITAFIYPGALIEKPLLEKSLGNNIKIKRLRNWGQWDLLAAHRFRSQLLEVKPDAVITFGNRAASLAKHGAKNIAPIIARTPNYNVNKILGVDAIFHTTKHLKDHISTLGYPEKKLFHVPNMVKVPEDYKFKFQPYQEIPVIGTMGRFVKKKGFAEFISALEKLDRDGIKFKAIIGGEGSEEQNLKQQVSRANLEDKVHFIGWVDDKDAFFSSIDIFCLPSLLEPFGIVLLEAFLRGKPVVTTNAEGPREIACHEHDALIVKKGNSTAMAESLKDLLLSQERAEIFAINAVKTIKKRYDTKIVSEKIEQALKKIVKN